MNIQLPANWPITEDAAESPLAGTVVVPCSATVVIRKEDGGKNGE